MTRRGSHILKGALLALWAVVIVAIYWTLHETGIPIRALPRVIRLEVLEAGALGPLVIITAYLAATLIPFPTPAIAVLSGSLYGPFWGSLFVVLGLNLASAVSFFLGRFFGRHFVSEHTNVWVRNVDELMQKEGVYVVMVMRLVFAPFDVVSLGSGMTKITFRQYAIGTFFGGLPGIVTFVVLGEAFTDPRAWILFGVLLVLSIAAALWIRRSAWARAKVFKKVEPRTFE